MRSRICDHGTQCNHEFRIPNFPKNKNYEPKYEKDLFSRARLGRQSPARFRANCAGVFLLQK
jgi:hypothetical protein